MLSLPKDDDVFKNRFGAPGFLGLDPVAAGRGEVQP